MNQYSVPCPWRFLWWPMEQCTRKRGHWDLIFLGPRPIYWCLDLWKLAGWNSSAFHACAEDIEILKNWYTWCSAVHNDDRLCQWVFSEMAWSMTFGTRSTRIYGPMHSSAKGQEFASLIKALVPSILLYVCDTCSDLKRCVDAIGYKCFRIITIIWWCAFVMQAIATRNRVKAYYLHA